MCKLIALTLEDQNNKINLLNENLDSLINFINKNNKIAGVCFIAMGIALLSIDKYEKRTDRKIRELQQEIEELKYSKGE